ncbi:MAG: CoA transferase, partial [Rhodospirillaceae bacterium]|nr:CoA transferase [Rhodospirillaceae bacterium]
NKKSVVLDLDKASARTVLGELIARCDVLINSLRPGTMEKWGFTEEILKESFPSLVVVYVSAFGRTGPKASEGGYDPIAQGFSGLSDMTGDADGPPMRAGGCIPVCDFMTGVAGALGAVLSLYGRDRAPDRRGQSVDIALYDVAFRMTAPLLSYFDLSQEVWSRSGNHSLGGAPTGHFLTGDDRWVCVSVQNDEQFRRLARLVNRSDWLTDLRYADNASRTKHRELICREFADWARSQTRQDLIQGFESEGLVAGPINNVADLAADPHLAARGCSWERDDEIGEYRTPDVVPRLSGTPGIVRRRAPALGADTLDVLKRELSYSDSACARLLGEGAFGE